MLVNNAYRDYAYVMLHQPYLLRMIYMIKNGLLAAISKICKILVTSMETTYFEIILSNFTGIIRLFWPFGP